MLILPNRVLIHLVDSFGRPVNLANVLLAIHIFANRKNDFTLQPFATDANGIASISREEMLAEVTAHYDSGLMDYAAIESCKPDVKISVMDIESIERALGARTTVWNMLLAGESQRWESIEQLRDFYRAATNIRVSGQPIEASWDSARSDSEYVLPVVLMPGSFDA